MSVVKRIHAANQLLPKLYKRVSALEQKVEELKKNGETENA
jgi:hypothetical protein